jgi:hypothetical protein
MEETTDTEEIIWQQAGGAYYAACEGRIAALLYWYGPGVHYLHGHSGDEPTEERWFLVLADAPGDHMELDAPAPTRGEQLTDLTAGTRAALDAATRKLLAHRAQRA